jgi:subtilase family serine protease
VEVALDVDVIGTAAPGAAQVVYFAPNSDSGFIDAISEAAQAIPAPIAISISWGQSEDSWTAQGRMAMDAAMADAAALGITVCAASGDNGSGDAVDDGQPHVDFPASSPHALACGGTKLLADPTTGVISSEVAWNETAANEGAGGGGGQRRVRPAVLASGRRRARTRWLGHWLWLWLGRWRAGGAGCGGQRRPGHRLPDLLRRHGPDRRRH